MSVAKEVRDLDHLYFKVKFPRRDILKYLFYRNSGIKRMSVVECECPDHPGNMCGVWLGAMNEDLKRIIKPIVRCRLKFKCSEELWSEMYAEIVGNYYLSRGSVASYNEFNSSEYKSFLYETYAGNNQIKIKPVTKDRNIPQPTKEEPRADFRDLVEELFKQYIVDVTTIRSLTEPVDVVVTKILSKKGEPLEIEEEFVPPDKRIKTLAQMCMDTLNWAKVIYDPVMVNGKPCKRVVYTTNDLNDKKLIKLYSEFDRNTVYRGPHSVRWSKLMPNAMKMLERLLDCDEYRKKVKFRVDLIGILKDMKLDASGGVLPMDDSNPDISKFTVRRSGKKVYMVMAAVKEFKRYLDAVIQLEPYNLDMISVVRLKQECRIFLDQFGEDLLKAQDKCREFFIPSLLMYFLSVIFGERMKFECGGAIQIGINMFYGGAYEFALKMNYNVPGMFWVDGDIDKFDKSVLDLFLMSYCGANRRYYDFESMGPHLRKVFERLMKDWAYNLTNKVVLFIDRVWRILRGVVYSGGKETSHLDSWLMALYFCLYLVDVMSNHPESADIIMELFSMGIITIVVYGDDHIWCAPQKLRHIINARGWAKFLKEVCRSVLRDYKEYNSFISTIDERSGQIVRKGPKFLKQYFILSKDSRLAKILPFRDIREMVIKSMVNYSQYREDIAIRSIGYAWISAGTNKAFYDTIKAFYDSIVKNYEIRDYEQIVEEILGDPNRRSGYNKIIMKMGITASEIIEGFPDYNYIRSRHVYDPTRCVFGKKKLPGYGLEEVAVDDVMEDLINFMI